MTMENIHEAPETVEVQGEKSDGSKLGIFINILKRFIGVKDISAVRLSLPAQLVEPVGNLEYWGYLDRPDYFVSIGESDDSLDRMLEGIELNGLVLIVSHPVLVHERFEHGKVCKPYNSILGEFFRCKWDVETLGPEHLTRTGGASSEYTRSAQSSESAVSSTSTTVMSTTSTASSQSSTTPPIAGTVVALLESQGNTDGKVPSQSHRVVYLTEQILHHPPVSAFYGECRERGISVCGLDHLSAHFTGTSIKVYPGEKNKGLFINLKQRDNEEYQLTHPCANITGFISLRVHPYVTVQDSCFITCPKTKLKAILSYTSESWFHKPRFAIEGVIFRYDPDNDTITKIKSVPQKDLLLNITGSWRGEIYFSRPNSKERHLLVDLQALSVIPKETLPDENQFPNESRKVWEEVTDLIHVKEWGKATRVKQGIEGKQRKDAATRKERNEEWVPKYFVWEEMGGRANLTDAGREMLETVYEE